MSIAGQAKANADLASEVKNLRQRVEVQRQKTADFERSLIKTLEKPGILPPQVEHPPPRLYAESSGPSGSLSTANLLTQTAMTNGPSLFIGSGGTYLVSAFGDAEGTTAGATECLVWLSTGAILGRLKLSAVGAAAIGGCKKVTIPNSTTLTLAISTDGAHNFTFGGSQGWTIQAEPSYV